MGNYTTNFIDENGIDLGTQLVDKEYLIDVYPQLLDVQKSAGLWTWGNNVYGQLGATTTQTSSPIQTIAAGATWKTATAGGAHSIAVKADGTLWLWGQNFTGQLGDNTRLNRSSPVQAVTGGTTWKEIAGGGGHTAATKADGTLWLWGDNGLGQLGDNSNSPRSSPVQTVAGGTTWRVVACGSYHTAAIKTDGTLWLWGQNFAGQLGDNSSIRRSSPVQTVAGGTTWLRVECGQLHTLALKTDGTLWCWGANHYGQIGDNSVTYRSSPVQTVAGGTTWKTIACGSYHSLAIKTDGTLWLWGQNFAGQLGDTTTTNRSSPVQTVAGGTNWKIITGTTYSSAAIKTDGTLWTWGRNQYGQLGDTTTTNRSSPIQTVAGGVNWKSVAGSIFLGAEHMIAIKEFEGW